MEKKFSFTIGLIGNPNVGKSTLFNTLTGSRQHVGNWIGKTVEKKEGSVVYQDKLIKVVDLPGAYSLTAYSEEESVTSDFMLYEKPEVVVQVVDAQNLLRNLFITVQLIELGVPVIIALNLMDDARKSGVVIDAEKMSKELGVPVIEVNAKNKKDVFSLVKFADDYIKADVKKSDKKVVYPAEVLNKLEKIRNFVEEKDSDLKSDELNWLSIKLLEGDYWAEEKIREKDYYEDLSHLVEESIDHLQRAFKEDIGCILSQYRYAFIGELVSECVERKILSGKSITDKLDSLVTNKFLGLPIFFSIIFIIFQSTFYLSEPFVAFIEEFFVLIDDFAISFLGNISAPAWMISLTSQGVISGVGAVFSFIPILVLLFLFIAIMEDSGYMMRVSYVMDKFMRRIGLSGKAFIPLVLGFGCNVPGIMATRTLDTKRDRFLSILINPFMSCGARIPVYALFVGIFFANNQGLVIFSLYLLGVFMAIIMALIFKNFMFKGENSPFLVELPPYRVPVIKGLLLHTSNRIWIFIKNAGTMIFLFSVLIWFLANLPFGVEYASQESFIGRIGSFIAPIFSPLGFGNWQASVALIFGVVAKEVVVGILGNLYGVVEIASESGDASLNEAIRQSFTPLSAYAFLVFILLYSPCISVLGVVKREMGSWKWPVFMVLYMTTLAWIVSFLVYRVGSYILG